MRVKRSDQITWSTMAYLQSVNGYFKSRYAEYSPWNATVAMLYLYALGGLNFFLSPMHFLRVFNASDTARPQWRLVDFIFTQSIFVAISVLQV